MEDEFAESAQRDYKNDEDFFGKFGLSEHFYGTMTDEMLPDAIQKVRNNLDRFIASTWNSKVIDYFQTAKFVYVERPRTRDFDAMKVNVSKLPGFKDITVMAAPDFGVTFSDTDFLILDWKSGKEDIVDEGISDQLKVYALKMLLKKGISTMDGMRIEAHEVYLQNMHTHGGVLTQQDIDGIIEKIQHDVEEQKNFLVDRDPYRNDPVDVIMFRKTSNAKKCEGCTFRDVCQKLA
ncbi:PD-(D/E)XK nuclease family protein [bacterium]|nr:PD-(D/E)XK nuclease family protein [bacterium]